MMEHYRAQSVERPAIHVSIGEDVEEQCYHWVEVGAEEEGVPCQRVQVSGTDPVLLAYSAAQSSRLGVGVGVADHRVVLHEAHMPAGRPVQILDAKNGFAQVCRMAGSSAGRLVKHMPLRFPEDSPQSLSEMPGLAVRSNDFSRSPALASPRWTTEVVTTNTFQTSPQAGKSDDETIRSPGAEWNISDAKTVARAIVRVLRQRGDT
ncbi:MAG: hypothetical protein A2Z04_07920 [Chloroflexi bacterium RBG_16_57_9]|nr:MAG: hypothetical protein A2Z04_07920 [Chloroflexi bacterium RBG_16_57_9]